PRHREDAAPETAIIDGAPCAIDWTELRGDSDSAGDAGEAGEASGDGAGPPPEDLDDPDDIVRAIRFLKNCEGAVQGSHGDDKTFNVAREVRFHFALNPHTCLGLMLSHYNPRCKPPWRVAALASKVRSAYKREEPIGGGNARMVFDTIEDE